MKRLTCLGVLALFAVLVMAGMSGSARETVEVASGTLDFDYTISDSGEVSYLKTVRFPCSFNELSAMTDPVITIESTNASGLTYDIDASVDNTNWVTIVNSGVIAGAGSHTKAYSDIADNIDNSSYMLYLNISANVTTNTISLHFVGDDVDLASEGITHLNTMISELDVDEIEIEAYEEDDDVDTWTVNDSISITNNDSLFQTTLTDVNFTLNYPDGAETEPVGYWTVASVTWGDTWTPFVEYEKANPYYEIEEDIDGYTIQVHSEEELNDIVFWDFEPEDYGWDVTEDDDLEITVNDDTLEQDEDEDDNSWYWDDEDIMFEYLSLEDSEDDDDDDTDNVFEFDWTRTQPTTPEPEQPEEDKPWYNQEFQGIPIWIIGALLIIIIMIVIVAAKD